MSEPLFPTHRKLVPLKEAAAAIGRHPRWFHRRREHFDFYDLGENDVPSWSISTVSLNRYFEERRVGGGKDGARPEPRFTIEPVLTG